ncbi:NAD-dependent epimerase/dehydratase family protein [Candidatus Magnetobacterium casense]|uniref:NAD-dependent epimerase/dehydratase family protein n=1 Tax=Candidatus Magnetobacterium casense TaxID=1455061 RepID=UPI00058F174E|nr:NAD-dependent epimerase/dehydratase family protein [Candidatus Magnetobacterium casensis]
MKILVTGGAGFIGSNVVDAYTGAGHEVVVMDNLSGGKWENLNPNERFYLMDIRSRDVLKVFERERFDLVNHHAAQMSVPASVEDPAYDADVNVLGFINLLEASRKTGVGKVIFISSGGAIYGEATQYPTAESCYPQPLSPYAVTKAVSEQYLAFYRHQYALDYTVLRYANVYGPRQIPHGEASVVAIFMDRLLGGQQCLLYHYPDEPRGMIRDYCFVADVVEANLAAIGQGSGEAINIGTGREVHTMELFDTIFDALKSSRPDMDDHLRTLISKPARAGDLTRSCLMVDKAKRVLGFAARHSLAEGISKTMQWRLGLR